MKGIAIACLLVSSTTEAFAPRPHVVAYPTSATSAIAFASSLTSSTSSVALASSGSCRRSQRLYASKKPPRLPDATNNLISAFVLALAFILSLPILVPKDGIVGDRTVAPLTTTTEQRRTPTPAPKITTIAMPRWKRLESNKSATGRGSTMRFKSVVPQKSSEPVTPVPLKTDPLPYPENTELPSLVPPTAPAATTTAAAPPPPAAAPAAANAPVVVEAVKPVQKPAEAPPTEKPAQEPPKVTANAKDGEPSKESAEKVVAEPRAETAKETASATTTTSTPEPKVYKAIVEPKPEPKVEPPKVEKTVNPAPEPRPKPKVEQIKEEPKPQPRAFSMIPPEEITFEDIMNNRIIK